MPRILIVDDDSSDREAAARCLRSIPGLVIIHSEEGRTALDSIAAEAPDLVLTDLRMPGMDGLELVERIRADHPLVPVILMTSQGSERMAVKALHAGAASYVPKGAMRECLAETVDKVLDLSEARRSRQAVLGFLGRSETEFDLANDPGLIQPMVGYFQESLDRIGFGDESVRTQIGMALMEAVSNGMIHGNLEVSSALRRESWEEFSRTMEARRAQEPYASRRLHCTALETKEKVEYVIRDEGPGFDPSALPDPRAPENVLEVSGRGIMLIRTFMDRVSFNTKGNEVRLAKDGGGRAA
jgi:CheY-like chemotaxis protein